MPLRPTYDVEKDYKYNFHDGPFYDETLLPPKREIKHQETFLGFKINSRFGVPAGPLLNSKWIKLYARLGFDIITYKTVRSRSYPAHQFPNCLFLDIQRQIENTNLSLPLFSFEPSYSPTQIENVTITNSFGVPSQDPDYWQKDVNISKEHLDRGQLLILSVMGTPEERGDWREIVNDYVRCAKLAEETSADIIELNLSCPNASKREGSIYIDPNLSKEICNKVRREIKKPLFLKIGFVERRENLEQLLHSVSSYIEGAVAINTIKMKILNKHGQQALPGEKREFSGVCGAAIKNCAFSQVKTMIDFKRKYKNELVIVGVGGVMTPEHIEEYLNLGADAVQSATGAMWNPLLAHDYYKKKITIRMDDYLIETVNQ